MLNLASATRPEWAGEALATLDEILLDHASCEKKAASTALGLLFRYPEETGLHVRISEVAREELEHYELVLAILDERGIPLRRIQESGYGGKLYGAIRKDPAWRLLDVLLVSALIEARSCERFKLLAAALEEPEPALAAFYKGLLACEASHHKLYLDLAFERFPEPSVRERLRELASFEAEVLATPGPDVRVHS